MQTFCNQSTNHFKIEPAFSGHVPISVAAAHSCFGVLRHYGGEKCHDAHHYRLSHPLFRRHDLSPTTMRWCYLVLSVPWHYKMSSILLIPRFTARHGCDHFQVLRFYQIDASSWLPLFHNNSRSKACLPVVCRNNIHMFYIRERKRSLAENVSLKPLPFETPLLS